MILRKSPAYSLLTAAFFAPYALGCQTAAPVPEQEAGSAQMTVAVSAADGTVEEVAGSFEDMVGPSLGMLPEFEMDGELAIDGAALLEGTRTSFELPTGELLVVERDGNSLYRVNDSLEYGGESAMLVQWNDALDTMWITAADDSYTTIHVEGLEDPGLRARYIGYTAALMLGAHVGLEPEGEVGRAIPVIIGLAALGIVSFTGCIFFGNDQCLKAALASCGSGNVATFKTICGAGTDVTGKFQLGFNCSFACR